ncbi:hypothetical protein E4U57_001801 [Claviceps arundinis]|uniref:LDB19 N-terminal domain-containing protein n=1 Tax=Claviceps arundinis TaxID=1623583 RepID=A0ABQ7PKR1_9HYPO|nr:hypothetical protein E4U57_001801 [Claviceps arundinis]
MPHLVSNFLRSSSGNISHIKKAAVSRSSRTSSRNNSVSASPYASDSEDHAHHISVKMPELGDALKKHRLSLPFGRSRHDAHGHGHSHSHAHNHHTGHHSSSRAPASMEWSIESPPVVLYGTPEESSGALISGLLYVDVHDEVLKLDSFVATLTMHTKYKKPFQGHCADCQTKITELRAWQFLAQPTSLRRGNHQFPFSTLLAGNLPASTNTPVVSISYHFKAQAMTVSPSVSASNLSSTSSVPLKFERTLHIKRSLPEPLYPHHSVRIFPPTNIKASAHYNSVIHPTSSNTVTLKLDGLMTHNEKVHTVDLWKLRKVSWKLEETIKTLAPACDKHSPSTPASTTTPTDDESPPNATPKNAVSRTETRILGEKQIHEGWKSDFSGNDGIVDFEFDYTMTQFKTHAKDPPRFACDVHTPDSTTHVSHALQLELIVSKEFAPEGKPHLASQTGTGRILRMHFAVHMTEYPGLGVSWDNEAPPVYQDVPPSPPGYPMGEERVGLGVGEGKGEREPPIEYACLEALEAQRQGSGSEPGSRRPSASAGRAIL